MDFNDICGEKKEFEIKENLLISGVLGLYAFASSNPYTITKYQGDYNTVQNDIW